MTEPTDADDAINDEEYRYLKALQQNAILPDIDTKLFFGHLHPRDYIYRTSDDMVGITEGGKRAVAQYETRLRDPSLSSDADDAMIARIDAMLPSRNSPNYDWYEQSVTDVWNALPRLLALARLGLQCNDKLYSMQIKMARREADWQTELNNKIYDMQVEMQRRDADWQSKLEAQKRDTDGGGSDA